MERKPIIKSRQELIKNIQVVNEDNFSNVAMSLFHFQYKNNELYQQYINNLLCEKSVWDLKSPVFMPIEAFKQYEVKTGVWHSEDLFTSSGTTGTNVSKHHVRDIRLYLASCVQAWEQYYDKVENYCYLCLLPGYMEREGSSLIMMMKHFVEQSNYQSGFYLNNHADLHTKLEYNRAKDIPTVLFGVSFGLLDFIAKYQLSYKDLIIMETGGMKGRREEMIKEELHLKIKDAFGVQDIHSEYGMTELFSQAYSEGGGLFRSSRSMKVVTTEITDPLSIERRGKTGLLNIIDLYNVDTCAFIQTQDLGILYDDDSFRLMGRLDQSDIRGCNLMVI